jgi:hypothetical protein
VYVLRATFGMVNFIITIIWKNKFIFLSVLLLSSLFLNTVIKLCTTYLSVYTCVWVPGRVGACMYPYSSIMLRVCAMFWRHFWPLWLHQTFRSYFKNGAIFGKKLLKIKCVYWFSLQILFKTFLILRRIKRDIVINVKTFTWSNRYSCRILIKFEFSRLIIEESLNIEFYQNPPSGSRVVPCEQTDGQTRRS